MNWTRGHLRPGQSPLFFGWLAKHQNRLHTWILGGTHLIVIVAWDTKGKKKV